MRSINLVLFLAFSLACASGCAPPEEPNYGPIDGSTFSAEQEVRITFLHTSDIHSRLLPFRMQVTYTDNTMGLKQENEPFGGIARVGHIINRERARGGRVLYFDSGDVFQGAPIFNVFHGEAEFKAMSYLNPDAVVVGNHEFDTGLANLIKQVKGNISFPFLAANYYFMPDNEMGELTHPYITINADGVKIGVVGMGDFGSITSLTDIGNSMKMMPMNNVQVVNDHIALLRPYCDLVVLLSHAGLSDDQEVAELTQGVDIIFGGHLHIVLNPPKVVKNKIGEDVLLVHSGAFAKYVGRLDIVATRDETGRMRVTTHDYNLFPVDSTVPEDPELAELMEDYRLKLNQAIDLTSVFGYSPKLLTKYGYEGGDSSLGNLVSEAIRKYARVDVGFTNTLGIRSNMYPGPITLDDLFNIFPFENSITLMYMSGTDIRSMLDYVAQRSSGRGCVSQLQVAGLEFTMNCNSGSPPPYFDCHDEHLYTCMESCSGKHSCNADCIDNYKKCVVDKTGKIEDQLCLDGCLPEGPTPYSDSIEVPAWECIQGCFPRAEAIAITDCPDPMAVDDISTCKKVGLLGNQIYEVATNDYIAHGGSGFTMLKSNNTQQDTELPLRDAVLEVIMTSDSCLEFCLDRDGDLDLEGCSVYQGCLEKVGKFEGHFCDKIDKTGGKDSGGTPMGCALDTGVCYKDVDCYFPEFDCAGAVCATCKSSAECLGKDPDSLCVDGFCMHRNYVCVDARCVRTCETEADCPGEDSERELKCISNRCQPRPSVACLSDYECSNALQVCFGDRDICSADSDCSAGELCRERLCIPSRAKCSKDGDCPAGQGCAFGLCTNEKKGCTSGDECGEYGTCKPGGVCSFPCGNCQEDNDCPGGLACVKNLCVHQFASCVDFRCRIHCVSDFQCKSGEYCKGGMCRPSMCDADLTGEETCRLNALWKATEKCINAPCVDSRVDGRIGRILPENLGDLEFGFVPENPEDIDYE